MTTEYEDRSSWYWEEQMKAVKVESLISMAKETIGHLSKYEMEENSYERSKTLRTLFCATLIGHINVLIGQKEADELASALGCDHLTSNYRNRRIQNESSLVD